jgi:cytochrome c553
MALTNKILLAACAGLLFASVQTASAGEIGRGNPVAGKLKLKSEVCRECHGEDGNSISDFAPNLAGQNADYIVKQVHNFQAGQRENPTMDMMAPTVDDSALIDIAAFFASNEPIKSDGAKFNAAAQDLFANGDADRTIPPCAGCHGADGKGSVSGGMVTPLIGGQRWTYLRAQLRNWKLGERANSPDGIMNKIAGSLTDAEIEPLARYIAGL